MTKKHITHKTKKNKTRKNKTKQENIYNTCLKNNILQHEKLTSKHNLEKIKSIEKEFFFDKKDIITI